MRNEEDKLKRILGELPEREPRQNLWDKIEDKLNLPQEKSLKNAIKSLPGHSPREFVWDNIQKQQRKDKIFKLLSNRYYSGVAASLLLIISISLLIGNIKGKEDSTVIYYEEILVSQPASDMDFTSTVKAKEYISGICKKFESKCETEKFRVLESALSETSTAIEKAEELLDKFPNDPDINRQLMRFRKQEAKLTRQLLTITM
jgi:hypothetical protein